MGSCAVDIRRCDVDGLAAAREVYKRAGRHAMGAHAAFEFWDTAR